MTLHERLWTLEGEHALCAERVNELLPRQIGRPDNRKAVQQARRRMLEIEQQARRAGVVLGV
jgi:hypothetical protein